MRCEGARPRFLALTFILPPPPFSLCDTPLICLFPPDILSVSISDSVSLQLTALSAGGPLKQQLVANL